MTKEEAIGVIESECYVFNPLNFDRTTRINTALDIAIKALEQEAVLDNIKAEIDQKQYDFMNDEDYAEGIRFGLMLAYQIIDKYKAEMESEE